MVVYGEGVKSYLGPPSGQNKNLDIYLPFSLKVTMQGLVSLLEFMKIYWWISRILIAFQWDILNLAEVRFEPAKNIHFHVKNAQMIF